MDVKLNNVIAIVNSGYSDMVMEIAKDNGAKGGTIIPANGSVTLEAVKLYGIGIHPEKEIIMILAQEEIAKKILEGLYDKLGQNPEVQGIFFALPVSYASENLLSQYQSKKENED